MKSPRHPPPWHIDDHGPIKVRVTPSRSAVRLSPDLAVRIETERKRREELVGVPVSTQAVLTALIDEALASVGERQRGPNDETDEDEEAVVEGSV